MAAVFINGHLFGELCMIVDSLGSEEKIFEERLTQNIAAGIKFNLPLSLNLKIQKETFA